MKAQELSRWKKQTGEQIEAENSAEAMSTVLGTDGRGEDLAACAYSPWRPPSARVMTVIFCDPIWWGQGHLVQLF